MGEQHWLLFFLPAVFLLGRGVFAVGQALLKSFANCAISGDFGYLQKNYVHG
jgi:hypothetical protein